MDLKTLYRQNFLVLCKTLHQRKEVLGAMISAVAEDSIIRLSEYSIHLLKKTRTPSGILFHIRVIDNKTDSCVLQGPVMLPASKTKTATKTKTAPKKDSKSEPSGEPKHDDVTEKLVPGYNRHRCPACSHTVQVAKSRKNETTAVLCESDKHPDRNVAMNMEMEVTV